MLVGHIRRAPCSLALALYPDNTKSHLYMITEHAQQRNTINYASKLQHVFANSRNFFLNVSERWSFYALSSRC